ncbi:MAG: hydrogenase maturation nickel metallochaperone HypA [Myxococcota bacterium]
MHELSITRNIVSIVSERAAGRPVRRIHLRIGALAGIEVGAIEFCFGMCTEGTALEGAELVVHEVEGRGECERCGEQMQLQHLVALCQCERRAPLRIVAGEELLIQSMEL